MSAPDQLDELLLEVKDLAVEVNGTTILENFNLRVPRGLLVELVGANGCGKSTVLRHLAGARRTLQGTIDLRSTELLYVGQKLGLDPILTVRENLTWLAKVANQVISEEDVDQALKTFRLELMGDSYAGTLSSGQTKRCALARLLLADCDLWLLDEPLTTLDAGGREIVKELLADHLVAGGGAVVATHESLGLEATQRIDLQGV